MKAEDGNIAVLATTNRLEIAPKPAHTVFRPNSMRGILNHFESILLAQGMNARHVTWLPTKMHRHYHLWECSCLLGSHKLFRQGLWAHVVCAGIDIDKIDLGATIQSTVGTGNKSIGTGPQPITRAKLQCQARNMKC
jgi:hypothetical protein